MKASRPSIFEYLTSPGCVVVIGVPLSMIIVTLCAGMWDAYLRTGSFLPSIRGPFYLVVTGDNLAIVDAPGQYAREHILGRGEQGERLEIVGFVKTGGFGHSWVVAYGDRIGFVSVRDNRAYEITCTNENTSDTGYADCVWGIERRLPEYDYDTGLPKKDR